MSKLRQEFESQKTVETKPTPVKTFVPKVTATIPKHDFSPVQENIKDMQNEKENKKCIADDTKINKLNKNIENSKLTTEENANMQNNTPPKPLPRISRSGSICEQTEDVNNFPKPVAKPRTNSSVPVITPVNPNMPIVGGYKVLFDVFSIGVCFF